MIQQGADIIFPVAGPAGLGGLQAAKDADARGIWVDTDGCVSAAEYCDILLTSVIKGMDVAVDDGDQGSRSTARSTTSCTSAPWRTTASAWRRSTTRTARSTQEVKDKIEELKAADHRRSIYGRLT